MLLIYAALIAIPGKCSKAAGMRRRDGHGAILESAPPLICPHNRHGLGAHLRGQFQRLRSHLCQSGSLGPAEFLHRLLGTFLYRTFFGFQLQLGDPNMGAAIASIMFLIILNGVMIYLFLIQTRLRRYQF